LGLVLKLEDRQILLVALVCQFHLILDRLYSFIQPIALLVLHGNNLVDLAILVRNLPLEVNVSHSHPALDFPAIILQLRILLNQNFILIF
jgi:hypothetical protein